MLEVLHAHERDELDDGYSAAKLWLEEPLRTLTIFPERRCARY
jgi:hypothetical protein